MFEDDFQYSETITKDQEILNDGFLSSYNESYKSQAYYKDPRFLTLKRLQNQVKDLQSLKNLMGHNEQILPSKNQLEDDFQEVETEIENSIMYRFDLFMVDLAKGGIDIKITDSDMIKQGECFARNGPAGQYTFQNEQQGIPKFWNFDFVLMNKQKLQSLE